MTFLFRKQKANIGDEAERDIIRRALLKSTRNLGYEVGYYRHSEIGWVDKEYTKILEKAKKYQLEDDIRELYDRSKKKGAKEQGRAISKGFSRKSVSDEKTTDKQTSFTKSETTEQRDIEEETVSELAQHFLDIFVHHDIPEATSRPDLLKRTAVVDHPSFLNSLQFLRRR